MPEIYSVLEPLGRWDILAFEAGIWVSVHARLRLKVYVEGHSRLLQLQDAGFGVVKNRVTK